MKTTPTIKNTSAWAVRIITNYQRSRDFKSTLTQKAEVVKKEQEKNSRDGKKPPKRKP
ncbi:MAG: hypothetical protein RIE86_11880 [Imperialibacter sp.]|uniref:hypothetical protein n=1 Tax=Imperialibacter sp. TaxID=2038411 RepID=UPI0032EC5BD7